MITDPFIMAYKATVERVWKAITDKEEMGKWHFDLPDFKKYRPMLKVK